jgi:hypothetical protein
MGRAESPPSDAPRSVRVFRVRLDAGGYDDGGAYWGLSRGDALYCARCDEGGRRFVRARSRFHALQLLEIPAETLKRRPLAQLAKMRALDTRGDLNCASAAALADLERLGY